KEYITKIKEEYKEVEFISAGSSLKMCRIAEGSADIYPRLGPTMEWDIASGHIIILESGKKLYKYDTKEEMPYNKASLVNDSFICY
ncbi:MAG: inositol monophosphatase family protein, partial [Vampirovibrionia bacterium]